MDRVELMSALEDRYQVDLNDANFTKVSTVADLERLLREPQKSRAKRLSLSAMGAALADHLDSQLHLLPAHLAGDLDHGAPEDRWPREPAWRRGAGADHVQSRYLHRHRLCAARADSAAAAQAGRRHVGRAAVGDVAAAAKTGTPFRRWAWQAGYWLVVALFNVFPLPQQSGVRESFAYAGESVDRGYSVLVFPEGVRTADGKPCPFRSGIGMLAARLDIPVVPMRIDGLYDMKMAGRKIARPGQLTVVDRQAHALSARNSGRRNHPPDRAGDVVL